MCGLRGRVVAATPAARRIGLTRTGTDPALLAAWWREAGSPATMSDVLGDLVRAESRARGSTTCCRSVGPTAGRRTVFALRTADWPGP